jgi:threonine synthase
MDIQVSSNFERLLFDLAGRDPGSSSGAGGRIAGMMAGFETTRAMTIPADMLAGAKDLFTSVRVDSDGMALALAHAHDRHAMLIDPHTAIGYAAAREVAKDLPADVPVVTLATAHPAKFRDAVERATGQRPGLPTRVGNLFDREERYERLVGGYDAVRAYVLERAGA